MSSGPITNEESWLDITVSIFLGVNNSQQFSMFEGARCGQSGVGWVGTQSAMINTERHSASSPAESEMRLFELN